MFAPSPVLALFDLLVGLPSAPDGTVSGENQGSPGTHAEADAFGRTLAGFLVSAPPTAAAESLPRVAADSPTERLDGADEDPDGRAGAELWTTWTTSIETPVPVGGAVLNTSEEPAVDELSPSVAATRQITGSPVSVAAELTLDAPQVPAEAEDPTATAAVAAVEAAEVSAASEVLAPPRALAEAEGAPAESTNDGHTAPTSPSTAAPGAILTAAPAATGTAAPAAAQTLAPDLADSQGGHPTPAAQEFDASDAGPVHRDSAVPVATDGASPTVVAVETPSGDREGPVLEGASDLTEFGPSRTTGTVAGEPAAGSAADPARLPLADEAAGTPRVRVLRYGPRPALGGAADLGRRFTLRDAPPLVLGTEATSEALRTDEVVPSEPPESAAGSLGTEGAPAAQERPVDSTASRSTEPRVNRSDAQPISGLASSSEPDSGGAGDEDPADEHDLDPHSSSTAVGVGIHPSTAPIAAPATAVASPGHSLHHSAQLAVADTIVRMGEDQLLASAAPKKAIVELTPAHLGRVQIEVVQLPNRSVEVHLTVETRETHLALEADADDLVEHLRSRSIEVTKIDVKGDGDSGDSRARDLNRERSTSDPDDATRRDGRQGRHSSRRGDAHFTDYRYWEAIR